MEINSIEKNPSKINLRSEEITEIMGIPPRWLIRWGITIIFIVIAIVLIGSFFFHYPDIVTAQATITSENPVSIVVSKANGKLTKIFFKDGSLVSRNDTIAVIENPAKAKDIFFLSKLINSIGPKSAKSDFIPDLKLPDSLVLGAVQGTYNTFSRAYFDLKLFLKQDLHSQKIKALESEVKQYNQYYNRLWSQRNLAIKDLELTHKQFARDSQLLKTGVIAAAEYEKSQASLLSKRQMLENARLNLSSTAITIEKLKQSIIETRIDQENQTKKLKEDFINRQSELVSNLSSWEKTFLLTAPSSGKLTYMNVWSDLQEVKSGDRLFTINPEKRGDIFAQITIPFEGAGKVKVGQRVTIKLDGYPYYEFGMVEGIIESISSGSMEKGFPAVVSLPKGAITSYGETLTLDRDLTGTAEVTTEDMSLLKRLLNPLKYIFKDKVIRN